MWATDRLNERERGSSRETGESLGALMREGGNDEAINTCLFADILVHANRASLAFYQALKCCDDFFFPLFVKPCHFRVKGKKNVKKNGTHLRHYPPCCLFIPRDRSAQQDTNCVSLGYVGGRRERKTLSKMGTGDSFMFGQIKGIVFSECGHQR